MPKSFKGYLPPKAIEFELASPDGTRTLTVHCKPTIPGSKFLDFMAQATDAGDFAGLSRAVKDVLNAAVVVDEQAAFWAFCDEPDNGIDISTLSEIAGYLSEQFAGERPTAPSGASAGS